MKKTILPLAASAALLAATGMATPALAQTSAVNSATLSLQANQLDKAMVSINQAIGNEKTKNQAKTWFTRGEIYERLLDPAMKVLTAKYSKDLQPGEAQQKAAESYQKALDLDGPNGEFGKQVAPRLQYLYGLTFNDAVKNFQDKDYDKAATGFRQAAQLSPTDTTAVLYTAYALQAKQDYTGEKAAYNQLLTLPAYKTKPVPVNVYTRLLAIASEEKNPADMQQVLQKALTAYPNNKNFMLLDLQQAMNDGSGGQAALDKLNKTIAADPTNANLYAIRGNVYDQQKPPKSDLAQADYRKAIELDPNNFEGQFNLGTYNYNQAATLYTRASKMDLKTYQLKGKPLEAEGKRYFESSLPYFEKALQIQPNDAQTLNALQKVYFRLGRNADSERMAARAQALKK